MGKEEGTEAYPRPTSKSSESILKSSKDSVGRNEKCSCGSELKYKKCCIFRKNVIVNSVLQNLETTKLELGYLASKSLDKRRKSKKPRLRIGKHG